MRGAQPTDATGRRWRRRRRTSRAQTLAAAAAATLLAGCGASPDGEHNAPGTNVRVNEISVRYAHLEDPDAPGTGYRPGDDVPLYLWFVNESEEAAALADVSSPVATSVSLTGGRTPVDLPLGALVEMGPDDPHFVLEGITTQIRGAEFVPVVLTFSDGTEIEIMVEAVEVGPLD